MSDSLDQATKARHPNPASIHVDLIRPVRVGLVEVSAVRTRRARTMSWFSLTLWQGNKECASARIIQTAPTQLDRLPKSAWAKGSFEPESLRQADRSTPLDGPWFGDLLDYNIDDQLNQRWFSLSDTQRLDLSQPAFAATIADYAAGVSRPDSWEAPAIKAFPNPMMSVVLNRMPEPGWVGLKARSTWDEAGLGIAVTDLLDVRGVFGASHQINVLIPRG